MRPFAGDQRSSQSHDSQQQQAAGENGQGGTNIYCRGSEGTGFNWQVETWYWSFKEVQRDDEDEDQHRDTDQENEK